MRGRTEGPLALYQSLVETGDLQADSAQKRVLEILNAVFHGAAKKQSKGLYLYGGVGCGKTMAMDLFFSSVQNSSLRVERRHFHDFLNQMHRELHHLKKTERPDAIGSPVELLGVRIAKRLDVLCFDEFAVTTIQDCVMVMPLFATLFRCGVIVVSTSNRAPENLYTDGLNRHLYLPPFLQALRENCKVHQLISTTDYRSVQHENSPDARVFCWPPSRAFVDSWFEAAAGVPSTSGILDASFGRSFVVPQLSACGQVARFSFDELCRGFFSADDYLYLARQVHTIMIDDVPRLSVDNHNEARRFTLLIDSCYEQHVRLVCSMAGSPQEILGGLSQLRDMSLSSLGGNATAGCGDGDASQASSGVLAAIKRVKESLDRKASRELEQDNVSYESLPQKTMSTQYATEVLTAEIDRANSLGNGQDVAVWRQGDGLDHSGRSAPPQVSKAWDDRRRITAFAWESGDPTAEQQTIKGVFAAAVASLHESGFAVERAISRLKEMQTEAFQEQHRIKHGLI
jgi:cell division protein ZapE